MKTNLHVNLHSKRKQNFHPNCKFKDRLPASTLTHFSVVWWMQFSCSASDYSLKAMSDWRWKLSVKSWQFSLISGKGPLANKLNYPCLPQEWIYSVVLAGFTLLRIKTDSRWPYHGCFICQLREQFIFYLFFLQCLNYSHSHSFIK